MTWLVIFAVGMLIIPLTYQVHAVCIANDDWRDAPCLDSLANGWYNQDDVNKWAGYYQYKGTEFMEQKRSEMENAIENETLQEWIDESIQNRNVYEYYFFSGRAPNTGEYFGLFNEFIINESSTIHDPYADDERYQMASQKNPVGGWGIEPQFDVGIVLVGVAAAVGIAFGLLFYWRKK